MRLITITYLVVYISALIPPAILHAAWIPDRALKEYAGLDRLHDPAYLQLKSQAQYALQGSWCSEEKMHLLMDLTLITRPQVCVEIGAFTGSTVLPVAFVLKFLPSGTIYAIDAWSNIIATQHLPWHDPNRDPA